MTDPKKPAEPVTTAQNTAGTGKVVEGSATLKTEVKTTEPSAPIPEEAPEAPLTKDQEKAIDAALGDAPEVSFSEEDEDEEALALSVAEAKAERNQLQNAATEALKKFHRLNAAIPTTTPGEHFIWGIGEARITVKDLRDLMKALPIPE